MAVKSMLYAIHSVAHDNEDGCYGDEAECLENISRVFRILHFPATFRIFDFPGVKVFRNAGNTEK